NREMLDGVKPGRLLREPQVHALIAFAGGTGTNDCRDAAGERRLPVHVIEPIPEPHIWNSHHGKPPGPALYCGRPSPVGNPDKVPPKLTAEQRAAFAVQALADYKLWLWRRINKSSRLYDPAVVEYILRLTPEHFAVCSCAPLHCHVEILIAPLSGLMAIARDAAAIEREGTSDLLVCCSLSRSSARSRCGGSFGPSRRSCEGNGFAKRPQPSEGRDGRARA